MTADVTTALDPATVRLSALRAGLFDGPGAAGFDALGSALRRAADGARDAAADLDALLRRDAAVHAGPAADGARAHLASLGRDLAADAGRLDRAAGAVGQIAGLHAAARRDVPQADPAPGRATAAALLGAALADDGAGGERRARLAVAAYQDGCNAALTRTLPSFRM